MVETGEHHPELSPEPPSFASQLLSREHIKVNSIKFSEGL